MDDIEQQKSNHETFGLWVTVIVEAIMIVVIGMANIYETRRTSELTRSKIEGLAEYSAKQGEKIDRMTTAMETFVGKKFAINDSETDDDPQDAESKKDRRVEEALNYLDSLRKKSKDDDRDSSDE